MNMPPRHMRNDIGQLTPMDEYLCHQIVDSFGAISTSEHSWTEKLWVSIVHKDGKLAAVFGLGRYHNRGVLDGWGAVSTGANQWTVRASRELMDDPSVTEVGPLSYEVVEPLKRIRAKLAKNDVQPISYDITFDAEMPAFFEDRHRQQERHGFRVGSDVVRYHQTGRPSGWVEVDGTRYDLNGDDWYVFRDHSWGTRLDVGTHLADVRPNEDFGAAEFGKGEFELIWSPMFLTSPSGEKVEYHMYFMSKGGHIFYSSGYRNLEDGTQERVARVRPELKYDDKTRRLIGGVIHFDMQQGGTRTVEVERCGPAGIHLGPGLYLGFDGKKHGSWKGELEVEGEYFPDTLDVPTLQRIRQLRDNPIRVSEGDWQGYGLMETIIHGGRAEIGLTAENSFI